MNLPVFSQSPGDPAFVQNPYPAYHRARAKGPLVFWRDLGLPAVFDHDTVHALLRDRRLGRECPAELARPWPAHLADFAAIEAHSMLELEPPRHTRLRKLVLRAFTSRRIAALGPEIETLCHRLIDRLPEGPVDLLPAYCTLVPVRIIARLLGVPEAMAPQLLDWSHAMVAMYQPARTRAVEHRANEAAATFSGFLRDFIDRRRSDPADDLITHLVAAEQSGDRLSTDEMITTCILLLNAGHEATVHAIGNSLKTLLETGVSGEYLTPDKIEATVEELLRHDPPLHMFTRHVYAPLTLHGARFSRGDQIALILGAANRDPAAWPAPDRFDPARESRVSTVFGGGLHFCVGAPLARLELQIALRVLLERCPGLRLAQPPRYADTWHFHGLDSLVCDTRTPAQPA